MVPAAGVARRLGPRDRSKEIEPVFVSPRGDGSPRAVAYCLLEALGAADINRAIVVTTAEKVDVRDELGSGGDGLPVLEHLIVQSSPASAYTVSIGTTAAGVCRVALGFPDVLWAGENGFGRLLARLNADGTDVVLGTFPPAPDYPTDGVRLDGKGAVQGFEPAESAGDLPTWTLAVWEPPFSRFLEGAVARCYEPASHDTPRKELSLTAVLASGLEAGFSIVAEHISNHPFLDIGEPARLEAARRVSRP